MAPLGQILAATAALIMSVVCLFYILSNALPSWAKAEVGSASGSPGLWRVCETDGSVTLCGKLRCPSESSSLRSFCDKIIAARAFVTIACIVSAFSAMCLFLRVPDKIGSNTIIALISKALPVLALIMGVIGVAVGISAFLDDPLFKLREAAILGIIAFILNLVGAIVAIAAPAPSIRG